MTPADLEALVAWGSADDVLEAMRGLSEKERRTLAPTALRLAKHYSSAHLQRYVIDVSRPDVDDLRAQARRALDRHRAACAALLASGSQSELARHDHWDTDQAVAALTERRPHRAPPSLADRVGGDVDGQKRASLAHLLPPGHGRAVPTTDVGELVSGLPRPRRLGWILLPRDEPRSA